MNRLISLFAATLVLATAPARLSASVNDQVTRTQIEHIDVVACKTLVKDVVTFCGALPAGNSFAPASNFSIPTLVGSMLDKGTTKQDKFSITQQLDAIGATLMFNVDDTMVTFSGKCLRQDLPIVIRLIAEQLRSPAFSEEEFDKIKKQIAGSLQRALEQTNYRASQAFAASVYPVGHPNYQPSPAQFLDAVNAATIEELRAFHQQFYGPKGLTLIAVGDVDTQKLHTEVQASFSGWTGGVSRPDYPRTTSPTDVQNEQTIFMADKPNVSVVFGQATSLRYSDPDALPLRVATTILGSGFTGRLMATVRDQEGLTYGIGARVSNDNYTNGDWRITANFSPELLEKGLASTRRELTSWYEKGVTADEVERTKTNLAGTFQVSLATTDGLAAAILTTINRGYPISWIDTYPQQLTALTADQVNAAIKKHLNPDHFVLIKAGTVPVAAE